MVRHDSPSDGYEVEYAPLATKRCEPVLMNGSEQEEFENAWQCDYCQTATYGTEKACAFHERKCHKKPAKSIESNLDRDKINLEGSRGRSRNRHTSMSSISRSKPSSGGSITSTVSKRSRSPFKQALKSIMKTTRSSSKKALKSMTDSRSHKSLESEDTSSTITGSSVSRKKGIIHHRGHSSRPSLCGTEISDMSCAYTEDSCSVKKHSELLEVLTSQVHASFSMDPEEEERQDEQLREMKPESDKSFRENITQKIKGRKQVNRMSSRRNSKRVVAPQRVRNATPKGLRSRPSAQELSAHIMFKKSRTPGSKTYLPEEGTFRQHSVYFSHVAQMLVPDKYQFYVSQAMDSFQSALYIR